MTSKDKTDVWMPLVIGDYKKHTGRLTRDLHGGYLLLIMEYWVTGPLLDDDDDLAAIVLATKREWKAIRPKLERFFTVQDGYWHHGRIDAELVEAKTNKARNVERARAAAEARWAAENPEGRKPKKAKRDATSMPQALPQECPSPSSGKEDDLSGQSSLSGRERSEALPEGASTVAPESLEERKRLADEVKRGFGLRVVQ